MVITLLFLLAQLNTFLYALHWLGSLCLARLRRRRGKPYSLPEHSALLRLGKSISIWLLYCDTRTNLSALCTLVIPCLWLSLILCAILDRKARMSVNWRQLMRIMLSDCFSSVQRLRTIILKGGVFARKYRWGIAAIFLLVCAVLYISKQFLFLLIFIFSCGFLWELHQSITSCRRLLLCWLNYGMLFSVAVSGKLASFGSIPQRWQELSRYGVFVLLFTVFWCVTVCVADHNVGKMAASIINTGTTILLLVTQFLCSYASRHSGYLVTFLSDEVQFYSLVILLPLVAAGYLAALAKEVQMYLERYPEK